MHKNTVGFLGGIVAGLVLLIIEQILLALNISESNMPGIISEILFNNSEKYTFLSWIIYALITGLIGWLLSRIISGKSDTYIYQGVITGIVLWALMNVIFMLFGITPTWSMGLSTCIITFLTHILLGIIIIFAISKFQRETD